MCFYLLHKGVTHEDLFPCNLKGQGENAVVGFGEFEHQIVLGLIPGLQYLLTM